MEVVVPTPGPIAATPQARREQAYPTLKESWASLGWFLLIMVLAALPVFVVFNDTLHRKSIVVSGLATVLGEVATIGFLWWYNKRRIAPVSVLGQVPRWVYVALPVITVAQIFLRSSLQYLHLPNWAAEAFRLLDGRPLLAFLMLGVSAPLLEEVLFRGILLTGLLRNCRPWVAIAQSALLFGLFHMNPAQIISAGILGLLVGWLYYRTQSLLLCIVVHALNNMMALLGILSSKKSLIAQPHEAFGSWMGYGIGLLFCALLISLFIWRVRQTTTPYAPAVTPLVA